MKSNIYFGIVLLTLACPAWAQDHESHYDRISLSASASQEVQQDELQASLYAMSEDEDARTSASTVSQRVRKALQLLEKHDGILVQTGGFNTHPVYRKQQITGWRSRQSITVKSRDATALSQLLGKLQKHVQVESIHYNVSDVSRTSAENELIKQAISQFKSRAQLVTEQMGRKKYRLVNMSVTTGQHGQPVRQHMVMNARAEAAVAPPIKVGTQKIQVGINGSVEIQIE